MHKSARNSLLLKNNWSLNQHKFNTNYLIISLLQSNWGYFLSSNTLLKTKLSSLSKLQNNSHLSFKSNPFYNNFTSSTLRLAGISSNLDYNPTSPRITRPETKLSYSLKKSLLHLFTSFVRINMSSYNELTIPHPTFRSFYLVHTKGGLTVITLSKLFQRWKNCYFLLYNLYYHNISVLTFSPSFFKKEVLALNWSFHKQFKFMWRYARPFLVHKPNKITNHGDFVFRNLRALGLSIGIVTDVLYHTKTIYYLKRTTFYSIGLVPTIYNAYTVDFALPTAYESMFTQIFFIRFLVRTKQDASAMKYNNLNNMWLTPLTEATYIPREMASFDTTCTPEINEFEV
jgi:hypothetical protein